MPHIILECSDNIVEKDFHFLLSQIHQLLVEKLPTELKSCKSRVLRHAYYVIADGDPHQAFVHLSINVLAGRSKELQQAIGATLMEMLTKAFHQSREKLKLQLSIALADLPSVYLKG
ncbi:MAG TPA: hypothetical protein PLD88_05985 [Candidatus Berkiella sp.]|nr:hypothetical protein [Candidatus Berkiella sp.]